MGDGVYTLSASLLQSLLEKERRCASRRVTLPAYSADADCVTSGRRDREARWMCAIGRRLGLDLNTVSVAITVFDRVLDIVVIQSKYVNCVALTCLYLAVKLHEECFAIAPCRGDDESSLMNFDHPQLKLFRAGLLGAPAQDDSEASAEDEEFYLWRAEGAAVSGVADASKYFADSSYLDASEFLARVRVDYSPRELTRMESQLLCLLDWDLLSRPTCMQFLEAMLAVAGAPHLATSPALRANFEAIATRWSLASAFNASTQALALLSLMFQSTFGDQLARGVTQALADIFKIDREPLTQCRAQVADVLRGYHAHAEFLQRTLAARSHSSSPFLCVSTARASPVPPAGDRLTALGTASSVQDAKKEIADVLYDILESVQQ